MIITRLIAVLLIAFQVQPAFPQSAKAMNKEEIGKALFGQSMSGEYPNGQQWQESFNEDGSTVYSEGNTKVTGKMQRRDNVVCFEYRADTGMVGGCFEVWQRSANCFDFYGTKSATNDQTTATAAQKRLSLAWSARAWYSDKPSTCVEEMIS